MNRKICFKCGYEADTQLSKCPQCGKTLKSQTSIRVLGGVLVFLGTILIAGMTLLIFWAINLIEKSGRPGSGSRFTGTRSDMLFMFGIFGLVLVFGLASLVAGLWQLIFGRRNKLLVWIIIGIGLIFLIVGTAVQSLT